MFRSWDTIGSLIFAEIEEGRGQNGTFLGDFIWNDPSINLEIQRTFKYNAKNKMLKYNVKIKSLSIYIFLSSYDFGLWRRT